MFSPLLKQLCKDLSMLPGIGPKSAQRIAFEMLKHRRNQAQALANSLLQAVQHIGYCRQCRTFTEEQLCRICADEHRDTQVLCVVASPTDMLAIEQSGHFKGCYFVLHGNLSPIDGIEPEDLELNKLEALVQEHNSREAILATNSSVEGEATAYYISELLRDTDIRLTRLAKGIPVGSELEFMDGHTLSLALSDRKPLQTS